ncbi:hypothetical protein K7X08_024067 [Anisodus acutangulus]|uniref:Uncharacterized protein n=1 Tax=Anisodus acutangulus TaxID=402998 RepID=A0A9Q1RFB4_9SOLA|nr:hypothetical protein K7X08_024067 [Anisodus acutangulus]
MVVVKILLVQWWNCCYYYFALTNLWKWLQRIHPSWVKLVIEDCPYAAAVLLIWSYQGMEAAPLNPFFSEELLNKMTSVREKRKEMCSLLQF